MSEVLIAEGVTKAFGRMRALDDVSFVAPRGIVTGLVGPNGSGKSTFVSLAVGLDKPTSGVIVVDDAPAGSLAARRAVAFAPDELPLPTLLTGEEYLRLVARLESRTDAGASSVELADAFALGPHLDKTVGTYSHGMKRRLAFAAVLGSGAGLLVMDEPFSGLDVEAVAILREALSAWCSRGRSALVTVHDLAAAERECGHVVVLSRGRMVAEGAPAELVAASDAATLEDLVLRKSGLRDEVSGRIERITAIVAGPGTRPADPHAEPATSVRDSHVGA